MRHLVRRASSLSATKVDPGIEITANLDGAVAGVRYALLHGQRDLLLQVDPRLGEESLQRLMRATDPGTTFREGIYVYGTEIPRLSAK